MKSRVRMGVAFTNHHAMITYGEHHGAPDCGVLLNGMLDELLQGGRFVRELYARQFTPQAERNERPLQRLDSQ